MKRWRLGLHQLCKLVENSIYIVEKIVNGNSSEVWNEKEGLKLSSLRPHIELSFTHSQTLLLQIFRSPIKFCYYFYIWLPLFWCTLALQYAKLTLQISSRRSSRIYVLLRQISSFYILVVNLYYSICTMRLIDVMNWLLQTCFEFLYTAINGPVKESKLIDSQYAELLFYEECEEKNTLPLEIRKRIRSLMHYEVSTNPFIASIRVERTPTDLKYQLVTTSTGWFEYDPMTPVSLPPSPNQRNSWKNSVLQRVNTTLETARERLLSMSSEISETCDNR